MNHPQRLLIALLCLLWLNACSAEQAEIIPTYAPTDDQLGTQIAQQSLPTDVSTQVHTPTATETVTPSPTLTLTPTVTASPTATLTPTETATETATHTVIPSSTPTATIQPMNIVALATPTALAGSPPVPTRIPSVVPLPLNASPTQIVVGVPTLAPTLAPGVFPTNTPRFSPTPTVIPGDHFWFWRPFPRDPSGQVNDAPARGYVYGSSAGGSLPLHHGLDIQNPTGTFVQSIGSGSVFFAGPDLDTLFGPQSDFYGNVVVIEHDFLAPDGRRLYSVYGHLSRMNVAMGDIVEYGQNIGSVGSEGVAIGPHLHLEIRIGNPYDYYSTYNPELWVRPWDNYGVLAARIIGPDGQPVKGVRLELIGRGSFLSGWTYGSETVNPDPYFQENFAMGDIRAGQYDLKVGEIRNIVYRDVVTVEAGVVTFIEIQLDEIPAP